MIKDLVDDGSCLFCCSRPVVGGQFIIIFLERILVFILVVICDLSCASCRKADLGLRRWQAAFSYKMLTLTFLLCRNVSAGANIAVRLRVGVC